MRGRLLEKLQSSLIWPIGEAVNAPRVFGSREHMKSSKKKPGEAQVRLYRNMPDIELCVRGKCIGGLCPCLCHTSLKLGHDQVQRPRKNQDRQ